MTLCASRSELVCLLAMLALSLIAGCAWFREPPGVETAGSTTGPKPMVTLKTLPDTTKAAQPGIDSTRTAEGSPPPQGPPATPPSPTPAPSQTPVEPLIASPEGTWELNGQTLNTITGPEGQATSIQAPVITHATIRITATRGTYFADKEQVDLEGNVRFQERKLSGRAAHAIYYRNQELLVADGGMVVDSDTLHLEGQEGTYDRTLEVIFVRGNVKGIRGKITITSDEAEWFRGRKEVFFRGHAVVVDPVQQTRITGERIRYDLDQDRAEVLESPNLVISTHPENPIHVTGDRLRANPHGDVEAGGRVEITRGEVLAKADSAFFDRDRHLAYLFGNPTVIQLDGTLNGDTLLLHFDAKDALERLQMHGNAGLRFIPTDSAHAGEVSTVRGDSLTMFFRGDTTDKVVVVGKAHSTYRPSPRDQSEGVGTNVVDGDTISILLASNEIERVVVAGNAKGTFVFGHEDSLAADEHLSPPDSPDSLRSLPPDRAPPDSVGTRPVKPQEKVVYSANNVEFWVKSKVVNLREDVTVDYGALTLTAGKVRFYSDRRYMEAEDEPVLVEHSGDSKKVVGEHMDYNIKSHEGTIGGGRTETESGFIYSERLRQIGEKQFLARSGNFTTCELAEQGKKPHFHFTSKKMRIYMNDKVIAKPVVMYIRDIPVLAVPFYVFSIRKGRHSGFLFADLDLGIGSATGRYFRNLGYYWAASPYWDLTTTAEYSENPSRFVGRLRTQYAKRYLMSGTVDASKVLSGSTSSYDVTGAHRMALGPWNLTARAEFRTSDFRSNEPLDPNLGARADRKLLSNASLTRDLFNRTGSFELTFRQDKDLNPEAAADNATILNETLPHYSFRINSRTLGTKGDEHQPGRWPFLSTVRWDLSSSGDVLHTVTQTRTIVTDSVLVDTVLTAVTDTLFARDSDRPKQARHNFNISDTRKLGDFLNISPQFTATENWVDREFTQTDTVMGFHRAAVWGLSASANTALYGTIPGVGPLRALRHVFRPSATFSYHPEFGSLTYARKDSSDSTIGRANRFPGVSALESRTLGLGLTQSLEAKIGSPEHPKKISLFRWDLGARYDFLAKDRGQKGWSQVASNFTQLLGSGLSFTSTHDPYHQFRFNSFQVTGVGYSLRGKLPGGGDDLSTDDSATGTPDESAWTSLGADQGLGPQPGSRRGEREPLTWSTGFTFSYGGSRDFEDNSFNTAATLNAGFEARLTKNWNLSYRPITWDITNGRIDGDSFQLTRYLHCWQADFGRTRSGDETSFYFKISIRDLPDIRYQQGRQGATGLETLTQFLP